jgi:phage shock protein E
MHYLLKKIIVSGLFASSFLGFSVQAQEEIWLDVRTTAEYQEAHVVGAAHIPYEEVGARINDLIADKSAVIHVYCRSGNRAGIALKVLHDMGYENAHNDGGLTNLNHKATIVR